MNTMIISLIMAMSPYFNIDPNVAVAIAKQESSLNPKAVGSLGEIGLMQIRPEYSKYSKKKLFNPAINVIEGLQMLSFAKKYCKHKVDYTWIVCYNAGVAGGSKIKNPKQFDYYKRIKRRINE